MGLFLGNSEPSKIFVGDTPISKVFLGDTQVRPTGWKPGANTIAYYPLENDGNDYSGNNKNGVWKETPTYVNIGNKMVTLFNTNYLSLPITSIGASWTISYWANSLSNNTWQETIDCVTYWSDKQTIYAGYNGPGDGNIQSYGVQIAQNNVSPYVKSYGDQVNTGWCHVVHIGTPLYLTTYINGVEQNSGSGNYSASLESLANGLSIGGRGASNSNYFDGYISEFIIEDKVRTTQEIADYYNQTKGNYGIS